MQTATRPNHNVHKQYAQSHNLLQVIACCKERTFICWNYELMWELTTVKENRSNKTNVPYCSKSWFTSGVN